MPAELHSFRIVCGRFAAIFMSFMHARAKHSASMFRYTLKSRSAQIHCVFLTVIVLQLLRCANDIETNPGPPMTNGEDSGMDAIVTPHSDPAAHNHADNNQHFDRMYEIINQLSRSMSDLSSSFNDFKQDQSETISRIDRRLEDVECTIRHKLGEVEEEQHVMRLDIEALQDRCEDTQAYNEQLQETVKTLEAKVESLDSETRRNNLLFFGIPRRFGETWDYCESRVRDVIHKDMRIRENILFDHVQRVGSAILVRFQSLAQRDTVLRNVRELRANHSPVFVREDFTETVRRKREGLGPLLKQLREDGKRARLRHDKLISEDGTFTYNLERQEYVKLESPHRRDTWHRTATGGPQQRRGGGQWNRHTDNKGGGSSTPRRGSSPSSANRQDRTTGNSLLGPQDRQQFNDHNDSHRRRRGEGQSHDERATQRYTEDVNNAPGATSADYYLAQHTDTQRAARASPEGTRLRGYGRGRARGSPSPHCLSPGHASPGFHNESPMEEGVNSPPVVQACTGDTSRPTNATSEAFHDAPVTGSQTARSKQSGRDSGGGGRERD